MDNDLNNTNDQSKEPDILLGEENMDKYGFVRFYYPEELGLADTLWHRLVSGISQKTSANPETEILIPDHYLIPLSKNPSQKISRWENFSIDDVKDMIEPMKLLCKRAGWNQTENDLKKILFLAENANFLAKVHVNGHKIPLGSGAVLTIGKNLNWISMILVHPEVRRQGIASALMYCCLKFSRLNNLNRIVGLDATPQGKKLYDLLGFQDAYVIWRCSVSTHIKLTDIPGVSIQPLTSYFTIKNYLIKRGFNNRHRLFSVLLKIGSGKCFIAKINDHIEGLVMSRPGAILPFVGPLIADDEDIAAVLFTEILAYWKDHNENEVLMDIPAVFFNSSSKNRISEKNGKKDPFPGQHTILQDLKFRRNFIRMYHLVSHENKDKFYDFLSYEYPDDKMKNDILKIVINSHKHYNETFEYMEKERNALIRYMHASGGPEFS